MSVHAIFEFHPPRRDEALMLSHIVGAMGAETLTLADIADRLHRRQSEVRIGLNRLVQLKAVAKSTSVVPPLYRVADAAEFENARVEKPAPVAREAAAVDERIGSQQPMRLVRCDGSETREKLSDVVGREGEYDRAAQILASHAIRAVMTEKARGGVALKRMLQDQAEALRRAAEIVARTAREILLRPSVGAR